MNRAAPRTKTSWRRILEPLVAAVAVVVVFLAVSNPASGAANLTGVYTRIAAWHAMKARNAGASVRGKLEAVNRHVNRIPYVSDRDNWDREDYWAYPLEMLGANGGDCEDYALAKYVTLIEMGVPRERLEFLFVTSKGSARAAHVVLAYAPRPGVSPLVLDNATDEIRSLASRTDLVPVRALDASYVFGALATGHRRGSAPPPSPLAGRVAEGFGLSMSLSLSNAKT